MSIADKIKNKKTLSTRKFINTKNITDYGIETYKGGELVYILIKPVNLSVLSRENTESKINNLMVLFKEIEAIEIMCISSRENFEENKEYLEKRLFEEKNQNIRKVLEKDLMFFDRVQIQTASAREFLVVLRFNSEDNKELYNTTNRVLKILNEQGFNVKLSDKSDIKRMVAAYFVQNVTQVYFEDINGIKYLIDEDNYF